MVAPTYGGLGDNLRKSCYSTTRLTEHNLKTLDFHKWHKSVLSLLALNLWYIYIIRSNYFSDSLSSIFTRVGWDAEKQIYGCPIHVDIKNNKFWIHRDLTEQGIATQLLKAGVSKENIVLGFRSPFNRQFTDFATA